MRPTTQARKDQRSVAWLSSLLTALSVVHLNLARRGRNKFLAPIQQPHSLFCLFCLQADASHSSQTCRGVEKQSCLLSLSGEAIVSFLSYKWFHLRHFCYSLIKHSEDGACKARRGGCIRTIYCCQHNMLQMPPNTTYLSVRVSLASSK